VASPFNEYAKDSLNLYRVIDPQVWAKLVGRVQGANFGAIYGKTKAMGYRSLTLPPGHTWQSFTMFLLSTLPARLRRQYIKKFVTSMDFWRTTGGGLDEDVIRELEEKGYRIHRNGVSNYTLMKHSRVIFLGKIPDHTDDIKSSKDIPSWKRMCYCILKNDHLCRFMGFGLTREQQKNVNLLRDKYSKVGEINGV
jgi:predicted phosphoadenosine phosphosulfate sulfurtransferase